MRKTIRPFLFIAEKINGAFPLSASCVVVDEADEEVDQV